MDGVGAFVAFEVVETFVDCGLDDIWAFVVWIFADVEAVPLVAIGMDGVGAFVAFEVAGIFVDGDVCMFVVRTFVDVEVAPWVAGGVDGVGCEVAGCFVGAVGVGALVGCGFEVAGDLVGGFDVEGRVVGGLEDLGVLIVCFVVVVGALVFCGEVDVKCVVGGGSVVLDIVVCGWEVDGITVVCGSEDVGCTVGVSSCADVLGSTNVVGCDADWMSEAVCWPDLVDMVVCNWDVIMVVSSRSEVRTTVVVCDTELVDDVVESGSGVVRAFVVCGADVVSNANVWEAVGAMVLCGCAVCVIVGIWLELVCDEMLDGCIVVPAVPACSVVSWLGPLVGMLAVIDGDDVRGCVDAAEDQK